MNNSNNSTKQSLSDIVNLVLILIIVVAMWGGMFFIVSHLPKGTVKYDCSIAEISPDVPLDVKQECRKIRMIKE